MPVKDTVRHSVSGPGREPAGSRSSSGAGRAANDRVIASLVALRSACLLNCHGASTTKQAPAKTTTTSVNASHPGRSRKRNRTPQR